ncbi:MAG: hypothetical protein WB562_00320 [Candidatus Sulfotelmatobacter sp.]
MRSRPVLFTLSFFLALMLGCTSKPSSKSATDPDNPSVPGGGTVEQTQKQPIVVPVGTTLTVRLGSALGSKLSQSGQSFSGTLARDVQVDSAVAIPQGANVTGTVVDARPLGKFAGGAVLQIRIDSISVNGSNVPVQASSRSFFLKGKGKRTGVMAGGGAVLGGIIGGLAGGGKGAAAGVVAGGGAGGAGAALTANKDIFLPAESAVSFRLTQPLEITQ